MIVSVNVISRTTIIVAEKSIASETPCLPAVEIEITTARFRRALTYLRTSTKIIIRQNMQATGGAARCFTVGEGVQTFNSMLYLYKCGR